MMEWHDMTAMDADRMGGGMVSHELAVLWGLEAALLVAFTAGLVWYFRAPLVPSFISAIVGFAWYMGLSGTLLLPADIADIKVHRMGSAWVSHAWSTVYWSTFVLAWVVMPILNSAWHAGELTWRARIRAAIKINMLTYAAMAAAGLVATGYLLYKGVATRDTAQAFFMAWGNTYGLMLIVLLMGHGLVEVPRQLWIMSCPSCQLQLLYFRATQVDTLLYDAIYALEDAEEDFERLRGGLVTTPVSPEADEAPAKASINVEDGRYLEAIQETIDSFKLAAMGGDRRRSATSCSPDSSKGPKKEKDRGKRNHVSELVKLHSRLREGQERVMAAWQRWQDLVDKVTCVEQIISGTLPEPQSLPGASNYLRAQGSRVARVWLLYAHHHFLRLLAVICLALSVMVVWSECTLAVPYDLSPFGWLIEVLDPFGALAVQAAVLVPFIYMSFCTFRSLFKLKLFGSFALNGSHQSLPRQLIMNAQYLVRLQFPLGYNFVTLLGPEGGSLQRIAFNKLMSNMAVVPLLGTDFNIYAPLLMVLLCLFTACRGYARLLRLVGIEHEDLHTADVNGQERVEEGRKLIERARRQAAIREARRLTDAPSVVYKALAADTPSTRSFSSPRTYSFSSHA